MPEQSFDEWASTDEAYQSPQNILEFTTDGCHAGRDGDCTWKACPQKRNYLRHCPLDRINDGSEW